MPRPFFDFASLFSQGHARQEGQQLATLNVNTPRFYCLLRKEFLYDGQSHQAEFVNVCGFGVASIKGHALGFHALTDNGSVIWRLPLQSQSRCPPVPLDWLPFWDCFSYELTQHDLRPLAGIPASECIRAKGASRTLTTRAMAAAPGALTLFNGAHRHRSWLGARTSRSIGLRLVGRLHFGYILEASIRSIAS